MIHSGVTCTFSGGRAPRASASERRGHGAKDAFEERRAVLREDLIELDNQSLRGVLPKIYARPGLDVRRLGELVDLISGIGLGTAVHREKDILGRVYEYFLGQFASSEGRVAVSSTRHDLS